jgi:hypothetical protein
MDLIANGRLFITDSSCLYLDDNVYKAPCHTRCMESYREVRNSQGKTESKSILLNYTRWSEKIHLAKVFVSILKID